MNPLLTGLLSFCLASVLGFQTVGSVVLTAGFDTDVEGFVFSTDTFRGTSQPTYASGVWVAAGGFSGGGLRVSLGGLDDAGVTGMSGGWGRSFDVSSAGRLEMSFRFKLTQSADYESSEQSQVLVSVDGVLLGAVPIIDYAGMVAGDGNGGTPRSAGWKLFRVDLGMVSAGTHGLVIGGWNSHKSLANESTEILIDDVLIETSGPVLDSSDAGPKAVLAGLDFERFKSNIQSLSGFGDRAQGTTSYSFAERWLSEQLEAVGYVVEHHSYLYQGGARRNTYVTKVGTLRPDLMFIVSAHFDGRGSGGAADDDGSGSSLVLEAARAFAQPGVNTDLSVRFVFWNNEETGLNGSTAYANGRAAMQGVENPQGSGLFPEPCWVGIFQHDMILWDHGLPSQPEQIPGADIDIEYRSTSGNPEGSLALANALLAGNASYSADYPAEIGPDMCCTDSMPFRLWCAAVSVRENQRRAEIGQGSNPQYHQPTDVFSTYSDKDFLLGFNAAQMTVGTVAELVGAHLYGNFAEFGAGCPGTVGTPSLSSRFQLGAFVGELFQLEMEPLPAGQGNVPFVFFGFSNTMWAGATLPVDLGFLFFMTGCNAYIRPDFAFVLTNLGGSANWELRVPMDQSLAGLTFYTQGMVLDPGANLGGAIMSNAFEATIGIR